jgi:hypothetical protein
MAVVLLCSHAAAVPEGGGAGSTFIAVTVTRIAAGLMFAAADAVRVRIAAVLPIPIPIAEQPCCQRMTRGRPSAALHASHHHGSGGTATGQCAVDALGLR